MNRTWSFLVAISLLLAISLWTSPSMRIMSRLQSQTVAITRFRNNSKPANANTRHRSFRNSPRPLKISERGFGSITKKPVTKLEQVVTNLATGNHDAFQTTENQQLRIKSELSNQPTGKRTRLMLDGRKDPKKEIQTRKIKSEDSFVCLHMDEFGLKMGWSNKIIILNCALQVASILELRLSIDDPTHFTSEEFPDVAQNIHYFAAQEENNIVNMMPEHSCAKNISWTTTFYIMRQDGKWDGCYIAPLADELMEQGRKALVEASNNTLPTLHIRSLEGECFERHRSRTYVCEKDTNLATLSNPCTFNKETLLQRYRAPDFLVMSDGQSPPIDAQFSYLDKHSFFVQYAMMAQSPMHVGNVLSTVDLLVSKWRSYVWGPGTTHPLQCYL